MNKQGEMKERRDEGEKVREKYSRGMRGLKENEKK